MQLSMKPVHTAYIQHLVRARPRLDDQLADVYQVLTAVTEGGELSDHAQVEPVRSDYVAYLRDSQLTFDQVVADIAAVCARVFLFEFEKPRGSTS